jgi:hypothetical protein
MSETLTTAEFHRRFPEPESRALRLQQQHSQRVYRLLWQAARALPEDCAELRSLMGAILDEFHDGNDTCLMRRMSVHLLSLAQPVIDEGFPQSRERIENFLETAEL